MYREGFIVDDVCSRLIFSSYTCVEHEDMTREEMNRQEVCSVRKSGGMRLNRVLQMEYLLLAL